MNQSRPKVLLVSQNLGTPNTASPWLSYSAALLECLHALGLDVTLVVERSFGNDPAAFAGASGTAALNATRLSSVYRYLDTGSFNPVLFYRGLPARLLALHAPGLLRIYAGARQRRADAKQLPIDNDARELTGIPGSLDHLRCAERFLLLRRFYSSANLRAVYGTGPAEIDARGYDLAVVDGLIPVRLVNAERTRIVTLVQDLSPVAAPTTPAKLRRIAVQALVTLAEHRGRLAFTSEGVREEFERLAGQVIAASRSLVLGPLAPERLLRITQKRHDQRSTEVMNPFDRTPPHAPGRLTLTKAEIVRGLVPDLFGRVPGDSGTLSDPALPYFAMVWRPEDQIAPALVDRLGEALKSRANLLVLGHATRRTSGPNVRHVNPKSDHERIGLLTGAKALVFPEQVDVGARLVEAVALGVRPLCPNLPANREYAPEAVFFEPGSVRDLVSQMLALLSSEQPHAPLDEATLWQRYRHEPLSRFRSLFDDLGKA
jgi:hypothetical protein